MNWSKYPLLQIGTGLYIYSEWYTVDEVTIGDIILSCKFGQVYWLYSKMLECEIVVAIPSSSHTITHTHTLSHNRQAQTGAEREEETGCNYYHCWLSLLKPQRTQGGESVREGGQSPARYCIYYVQNIVLYNVYVLYVHCTLNRCTHV